MVVIIDGAYVLLGFTVHTLEDLGFQINYDKSCLIPSTEIVYVGFLFNSVGPNTV